MSEKCQLRQRSVTLTFIEFVILSSLLNLSAVSSLYPDEPTSSVKPATSEKCQLRTSQRNRRNCFCTLNERWAASDKI